MLKKRLFWIVALLLEAGVLFYMYSTYSQVEQNILMVQGQYATRYAGLHSEWMKLAGGVVIVMLVLPFTFYNLVRSFKKQ